MLITLTPNPSLDLLFEAARLNWDDANRVAAPRRRPGGQGINVVRAIRALGGHATAVAPLGGRVGEELRAVLEAERTPLRVVPIAGETRIFVGVRERETGRSLLVNPRGPTISASEQEALLETLSETIRGERPAWVACCGSLPPGLPPDFYARAGALTRAAGARFVPDCDEEPLRLATSEGADLIVPNGHEAARLLGWPQVTLVEARDAAITLSRSHAPLVAITLGGDGAVVAQGEHVWHAMAPRQNAGSAVGAGDAFLGALLLALESGAEPAEALRDGVAAGTAALLSREDQLLDPRDFASIKEEVVLRSLA